LHGDFIGHSSFAIPTVAIATVVTMIIIIIIIGIIVVVVVVVIGAIGGINVHSIVDIRRLRLCCGPVFVNGGICVLLNDICLNCLLCL